jgi:6,7-dimethyl-8-ribityllumazine synthase
MAGKGTGGGGPEGRVEGARILIIEARYYEDIAEELLAGAIGEIEASGASHERIAVPGALEIPQVLAMTGDAIFDFDGVIALGCVIRGETSHYDIVVNNANHWLYEAAEETGLPVGNAILTVDTKEQALARARGGRAGKGGDAARACLRLIEIRRQFEERVT